MSRWPFLERPRIRVVGQDQDLPAKLIKRGSFEGVDLALLTVDEAVLPVSLRLRRNPLCKDPPKIGMEVINVTPEATTRSRTISPLYIAPQVRDKFVTLTETAEKSGSGVFDAQRKCLLGIVSAKVTKLNFHSENGRLVATDAGVAGYFVPASKIVAFMPSELHF